MAMLAEPRRKQKVINLRAKNNAWSNDSTKFGQRMLEKMGWKSGKGLGANENGMTEHVVARYKNDEKGLGFEDKNDQWTKHEDDFNALLANLSNASDNSDNLHSGVSLEDKSKKSKARIHYHKFTRGKDISRYSEKDLANIFGKKSFKNTEVMDKSVKEEIKVTEQIFTEKGSMDDYFKNKLATKKSRNIDNIIDTEENDYEEPSYTFVGFSQETNSEKVSYSGLGYSVENNIDCSEHDNIVCSKVKTKKKSKTIMNKPENLSECILNNDRIDYEQKTEVDVDKKSKKKQKRNKNNSIDTIETTKSILISSENCENGSFIGQVVQKKMKKSKESDMDKHLLQNSCGNDSLNCDNEDSVKLSKKNKKNKYYEQQNEDDVLTNNIHKQVIEICKRKNSENIEDLDTTKEYKKKKKRKSKVDNADI